MSKMDPLGTEYLVRVDDDIDSGGETQEEVRHLDGQPPPQRFESQLSVQDHLNKELLANIVILELPLREKINFDQKQFAIKMIRLHCV